jgi:hypothetical protein
VTEDEFEAVSELWVRGLRSPHTDTDNIEAVGFDVYKIGEPKQRQWADIILAGLHPFDSPTPLGNQYNCVDDTVDHMTHPLHLALMYAALAGDLELANKYVAAYQDVASSAPTLVSKGFSRITWSSKIWWIPPDPGKYGLLFRESKPTTSSISLNLLPWLSAEGIRELIRGLDYTALVTLTNVPRPLWGRHTPEVEHRAGALLHKDVDRAPYKYNKIAHLMRMASHHYVLKLLKEWSGVRVVLGIVRDDMPPEIFSRGLAALSTANESVLVEMSRHYGAAPTVDQLTKVRTRLPEILYHMPIEILNAVLREEDGIERLRAALLRYSAETNVDVLRSCLSPHGGREALSSRQSVLGSVDPNVDPTAWERVYSLLLQQIRSAREYRSKLTELVPGMFSRIVVHQQSHELSRILATMHPKWAQIENLRNQFARPVYTASKLLGSLHTSS